MEVVGVLPERRPDGQMEVVGVLPKRRPDGQTEVVGVLPKRRPDGQTEVVSVLLERRPDGQMEVASTLLEWYRPDIYIYIYIYICLAIYPSFHAVIVWNNTRWPDGSCGCISGKKGVASGEFITGEKAVGSGECLMLERRPDCQMSMTPMHMFKQMFEHSERPTSLHGIIHTIKDSLWKKVDWLHPHEIHLWGLIASTWNTPVGASSVCLASTCLPDILVATLLSLVSFFSVVNTLQVTNSGVSTKKSWAKPRKRLIAPWKSFSGVYSGQFAR